MLIESLSLLISSLETCEYQHVLPILLAPDAFCS
jgi:hypothetical protein